MKFIRPQYNDWKVVMRQISTNCFCSVFSAILSPPSRLLMIKWCHFTYSTKRYLTVFPKDNFRIRSFYKSSLHSSTCVKELPQHGHVDSVCYLVFVASHFWWQTSLFFWGVEIPLPAEQ